MSLFRKPTTRYQGLKICAYGPDGSGKSVYGLSFPQNFIYDAESKLGVYEVNPKYNQNMSGIVDSMEYKVLLDAYREALKTKGCQTFMTDSETYVYNNMQVSSMELEEQRAIKNNGNPDDQSVSQRGWGKIKLNIMRLRALKCGASSHGITLIDTAHVKDVTKKVGKDTIKVGETPDIAKNSTHEYDIILKFQKEKDIVTNKVKYYCIVEKDTTETFEVGTRIDNPTYENTYKDYIERVKGFTTIDTNYADSIESNMKEMEKQSESHEQLLEEFMSAYKSANDEDKAKIKELLATHDCKNYKKIENMDKLKKVMEAINQL